MPRMRGMAWDDLRKLLERNKQPWAIIRYYYDPRKFKHKISVLDRSMPRRSGKTTIETGYAEEEHFTDSHACEAAWFGGEIPMHDSTGIRNPYDTGWLVEPYRGVLGVIKTLLSNATLRRTDELIRLFRDNGSRI